jgi:hypothetical protein
MRKFLLFLGSGMFAASLNTFSLSAEAAVLQQVQGSISFSFAQATPNPLIKENRELLIRNGALARKIAGISAPLKIPTSGEPLKQNESLILQNQETFKAIAKKVGATVPALPSAAASDQAEKNHQLLLQNRTIVVAILKKLGIPPAPPPELKGTFVDKNYTLLVGNGKALTKIAAKLGV